MADNISVTPGTGKVIAADDVGGVLFQRVKIAHGADGSAADASSDTPFPVGVIGTTTISGSVVTSGTHYSPSASFTRPSNATPYSINDTVSGVITLSNFGPSGGGEIVVVGTRFEIDINAVPAGMSNLVAYLYNASPASAYAENAAWDLPSGDRSAFIGKIDLGTPVDLGSTLYVQQDGFLGQFTVPSGGTVYAYIVTPSAFTPVTDAVSKVTFKNQAV